MNGSLNLDDEGCEYVEVDPTGRYGRYNEILGKGASKIVYRAFDEYDGIEVAWNKVKLYDFLQSPDELERLYCEIHLLKTLKHKNIMKFYTSWVDTAKGNINFVTEMFTSGTLRQYRLKHRRVNIRAVKHWCRQILTGLLYLHSHDPPVIHRDLKCDNIFINGNQGEVKIGDLGLAAILRKSHAAHCVGTPEFMAPEVYKEEYNELVDIYSFGMCLLEMITFEYPYSECTHHVQIYNKVISGKKPEAFYKVKDPEVRQFIEKCLATVSSRLSARQLLNDPFLLINDYDNDLRLIDCRNEFDPLGPLIRQPLFEYCPSDISYFKLHSNGSHLESFNEWGYQSNEMEAAGIESFEHHEDDYSADVDITIKGKRREDGSIYLRLRIADQEGRIRNIYFSFDIDLDTALSVATEMVGELDITDQDVTNIAEMIDGEIASLVPNWKPGPGIVETPRFSNLKLCQNSSSNQTSVGSFTNFVSNDNADHNSSYLQCSNGCSAALHGRFEEVRYQADEPENHATQSSELASGQSSGRRLASIWGRCRSVKCHSPRTGVGHFDEKHKKLDQPEGQAKEMPRSHSFSMAPSLLSAFSDYDENEILWELRSLKAKYNPELKEINDHHQTSSNSTSPNHGDQSDDSFSELLHLNLPTPDSKKNLHNLESIQNSVTWDFQKRCPNSGTPRARNSEASEGSKRAQILKTAKNFFTGSLISKACHSKTSVPVDSVYICNTKSVRYL